MVKRNFEKSHFARKKFALIWLALLLKSSILEKPTKNDFLHKNLHISKMCHTFASES